MTGSMEIREDRRDGFNLRKTTCLKRCRKNVKEVKDVRRPKRFLALTAIGVETVQEELEIKVGSGQERAFGQVERKCGKIANVVRPRQKKNQGKEGKWHSEDRW